MHMLFGSECPLMLLLAAPFGPAVQDACGAQPLVTLFEGRSLVYGAAIVDVQTATISFASWQVRPLLKWFEHSNRVLHPPAGSASVTWPVGMPQQLFRNPADGKCGHSLDFSMRHALHSSQNLHQHQPLGPLHALQEADTQRSMLRALLLTVNPAEVP